MENLNVKCMAENGRDVVEEQENELNAGDVENGLGGLPLLSRLETVPLEQADEEEQKYDASEDAKLLSDPEYREQEDDAEVILSQKEPDYRNRLLFLMLLPVKSPLKLSHEFLHH